MKSIWNKATQICNEHRRALFVLVLFACMYGAITFVNHYNFRTYALDLGSYTNALYDYSHFQWNDGSTFMNEPGHLLHDHFDLYLLLFAPLQFVFGTYTLLVMQWFFVCLGAWGFYRYMLHQETLRRYAVWGLFYYAVYFGIFTAFSFDYHSNVVAASLFSWWWLFSIQRKWIAASFLFLAMFIGKESIPLWLFFVCLSGIFIFRKERATKIFFAASAVVSLAYFLFITQYAMPSFSATGAPAKFEYSILGQSLSDALHAVVTRPGEVLYYLFAPHHAAEGFQFAKIEFWILFLICGGWAMFVRPWYLIMIVPLVFQKMFHDRPTLWGVEAHYCIEFLPILAIAVFDVAASQTIKWRKTVVIAACIGSAVVTFRIFDATTIWMDRSRLCIYKPNHYRSAGEVAELREAIAQVPDGVEVTAQSPLIPHLALRDRCYTFPKITPTTQWMVLTKLEKPYPLSPEEWEAQWKGYMNHSEWKLVWTSGQSYVFYREK
jgi:uncharacterized membrane protein